MEKSYGTLSPSKRYIHFQGPEAPMGLLEFLNSREIPDEVLAVSRPDFSWLIPFGAVYVNASRALDTSLSVRAQDFIRIHLSPNRYSVDRADLKKRIVFENADFMLINKPCGLPMHPTLDNLSENLISGFDQKLFVTHRLDVPTSGLVVVAKTKEYQSLFNKVVSERRLTKIYQAFAQKSLAPGIYRHWMKDDKRAPKTVTIEKPEEKSDECILEIKSCTERKDIFEFQIGLLTGRTHQIRAQLSALGAPLIGDELYGGVKASWFGLHACELSFKCPKTEEDFSFRLHIQK